MKSSTLVLWCSALLSVTWGQTLRLVLLAPPESMDLAKVVAKKFGDGEPVEMTRATDDPESEGVCAQGFCNEKDKHHGFVKLHFGHPTDLPRPITLTMPAYTLQCDITVRVIEDIYVFWYVGWGLDAWAGSPDNMGITCTNTTNTT